MAQQLAPGSPVYNTGRYLDLPAALDGPRWCDAVRAVTARHEVLRARFGQDSSGHPGQEVAETAAWHPEVRDLRRHEHPEAAALEWMRADMAVARSLSGEAEADGRPADLVAEVLLRIADHRTLWYQRAHHLLIDGVGHSMLFAEIARVYAGEVRPDSAPTLAELVAAEGEYAASERAAADADAWAEGYRAGSVTLAEHPPTGPVPPPHRRHSRTIDAVVLAGLTRVAAEAGPYSWPDACAAVWAHLLGRLAGAEEVVLSLPYMRRRGRPETATPAVRVTVLPVRFQVGPGRTLGEAIAGAGAGIRRGATHQEASGDELRSARLAALRGSAAAPVAGWHLNIKPFHDDPTVAGIPARMVDLSAGPVEDLTVSVYPRGDGLHLDVDTNPDLYGEERAADLTERLVDQLRQAAGLSAASQLGELSPLRGGPAGPEALAVRSWAHGARVDLPERTLVDLLAARAAAVPDAIAVTGDRAEGGADGTTPSWTYRDFHAWVGDLAAALAGAGVVRGDVVAVSLDRSPEMVAVLHAVLRCGAAYLPLDTGYPPGHLAGMVADAAPRLIVTTGPAGLVLRDPAGEGADRAVASIPRGCPVPPAPDDIAYLIFTSGSTGRPKGVPITHRAIVNRLLWMQGAYPLGPADRVLQKTPISFDVSVWELFWPLIVGARLVVAAPEVHRDPHSLIDTVERAGITVLHCVPTVLQALIAAASSRTSGAVTPGLDSLTRLFCSGEVLRADTATAFYALCDAEVVNLYGPTEAAIDVTHYAVPRGVTATGGIPLGTPVWNTGVHVLDHTHCPLPPGYPGEIWLSGVQLMPGYWRRENLAADGRYPTGDLGLLRPDGVLEYRGRLDGQVKLRGQRIELDGVAAALGRAPGVREAAAAVHSTAGGDALVGYIVGDAEPEAVRAHAARLLPGYMVPTVVVSLPGMPTGPSGKLDRRVLPAPVLRGSAEAGEAPRPGRERAVATAFTAVLGVPAVCRNDNFFHLGGNSLSAVTLLTRLAEPRLSLGDVFASPTPRGLARLLGGSGPGGLGFETLLHLAGDPGGDRPLYCVHPAGGLAWPYGTIARMMVQSPSLPVDTVVGIQARGFGGEAVPGSLAEMAEMYVDAVRATHPGGPYQLLGWSVGGMLAHHMTARLQQLGERVELLVLLDAYPGGQWRQRPEPGPGEAMVALLRMAGRGVPAGDDVPTVEDVRAALSREGHPLGRLGDDRLAALVGIVGNTMRLVWRAEHPVVDGDVYFVRAAASGAESWCDPLAWAPSVAGELHVLNLPARHEELVHPAHAAAIVGFLSATWGLRG
ncbi:enterobactin non-ribosomal peptide synthetase EntF [Klugiella xanthotipulae]|uniref:Enterobactin synthetase component F n=2 Tax=Klugiella xanthotipulae TaxID=244735 RepID=A0A543HHA5_9MICO|nr:enterobactin synthetase component F [Klugiella xanthotipulae]